METTTDSITATRFDVEYDKVDLWNSMGDGGECLMRDGKFFHLQNGLVWPGRGFPEPPAYQITKTGKITARPCFHWGHTSPTEMKGAFNGTGRENELYLLLGQHKGSCWINDNRYFDLPCSIKADGLVWPDSMNDLELKILNLLS